MLKESENPQLNPNSKVKYLLFFDEPTVLTDQIKNSTTLSYLSKILYYLPSHTILLSATLPMLNELDELTSHYKTKFPNGIISEVVSNKTLIGCVIKDFDSNFIVPHSICKTQQDLKNIIKKIKNFPLLGKFYTLPFLMNLNNFCSQHNCSINLESIETFDQDSVLENILILLERISNIESKEIFDKFIELKINDIRDDIFDTSRLDVDFNKIVPGKLLTAHAFKYFGCCLIATSNPLEYAKNNLYSVVEKLKNKIGIDNVHKKYSIYLGEMAKYNEQIDKIKSKFTSDDKIDEEVAKLKVPKFEFDKRLEINTEPHIKSFAKYVKSYDSSMSKSSINFEKINITEYDIDDELKFLLYMGVGLFSKDLDSDYTNKVLEMLQNCELAYIIADESFCYGANYLISNVIINDDIGDPHSINTVLQLIGRTARVGKSWSGKVYLDKNTSARIKEFFMNPSFTSIEGTNITKYFKDTVKEIKTELDKNNQVQNKKETKSDTDNKIISQNSYPSVKIIKSGTPIINLSPNPKQTLNPNPNPTSTSSSNLNQMEFIDESNDIFTWKRGKNFKSVENNQEINQNKLSESNDNLWTLKNTEELSKQQAQAQTQSTKPNKMTLSEEWGGIRGKNKSTPKPELFMPKSFDELNNSKSDLKSKNLNSPNTTTLVSSNLNNQNKNYEQFDNINMFKRFIPKQTKNTQNIQTNPKKSTEQNDKNNSKK